MNQNDQMREALRNNIRGFLCERTGMFKFVLSGAECHEGWKEMMLIPNLSDEVIDSVLNPEPTPLVRLTLQQKAKVLREVASELDDSLSFNFGHAHRVANAIMDAMERVNGGSNATD